MSISSNFQIAVLPGDGIGKEVMVANLEILDKVQRRTEEFTLSLKQLRAGAEFYLEQGVDITKEDMRSVQDADAILLGAMGLQNVRFPNGT